MNTNKINLANLVVKKLSIMMNELEVSPYIEQDEATYIESMLCLNEIETVTIKFIRDVVVKSGANTKKHLRSMDVVDWDKFDKIENLISKVVYVLDTKLN